MLWQFPETLIGTAIAVAVFPRLARTAAARNAAGFQRLYRLAGFSILALALPSAVIAILFAQPIVALVLQRGNFDAQSTALVVPVLQFYALAIVGESLLELVARVFYANHDTRTPMFVAIGAMALRIGLMIWWRDLLGAPGLALAYAVGVCLETFLLWWLARRRLVASDAHPE
jgi:putative peptidoglycan lipid II flippase